MEDKININLTKFLLGFSIILIVIIASLLYNLQKVMEENTFLHEANSFKYELIDQYELYREDTQKFLDELDVKYNWSDAFDPMNIEVDLETIDSLVNTQL